MSLLVHELVMGAGNVGSGSGTLQITPSNSVGNITFGSASFTQSTQSAVMPSSRVVNISHTRLNTESGCNALATTSGSSTFQLSGTNQAPSFAYAGRASSGAMNQVKKQAYTVPFVLQDHNYGAPPPPTPPSSPPLPPPPIPQTSHAQTQSYKVHHIIPPAAVMGKTPSSFKTQIHQGRRILKEQSIFTINQIGGSTHLSSSQNGVIVGPSHNASHHSRTLSLPTPTIQHTSNLVTHITPAKQLSPTCVKSVSPHQVKLQQVKPLTSNHIKTAPALPPPSSLHINTSLHPKSKPLSPISKGGSPSGAVSQIMASMPPHKQQFMPHPKTTATPSQAANSSTPISPHNVVDPDEERLSDRSSSAGPSGEETETAPEGEGEELQSDDSVTRCICDFTHDDGYMIQCDRCFVWQHVDCMDIDRNNIPDEYLCEACCPRDVNKTKARSLQNKRRQEIKAQLSRISSSDSEDHSQGTSTQKGRGSNKQNERKVLKKKKQKQKEVKPKKVQMKKSISGHTNREKGSVEDKEKKTHSKGKRRQSNDSLKPQENTTLSLNIEQLRLWVEDYEIAVTNHYSPELRARIQSARINGISPEFRESTQGALLGHRCRVVPRNDVSGQYFEQNILVATMRLLVGTAIIEYQGKYTLRHQWNSTVVPNNLPYLPHVLQYTMPKEDLSICIDARTYGNDARFARRSDDYNAEIKHVVERGSLHLYIVACKQIDEDEEIILPMETAIRLPNIPVSSKILPISVNKTQTKNCLTTGKSSKNSSTSAKNTFSVAKGGGSFGKNLENFSGKMVSLSPTRVDTSEEGSELNVKVCTPNSKKAAYEKSQLHPLALAVGGRVSRTRNNSTDQDNQYEQNLLNNKVPTSPSRSKRPLSGGPPVSRSPLKGKEERSLDKLIMKTPLKSPLSSPIASPVRAHSPLKISKTPTKGSPKSPLRSPARSLLKSPLRTKLDEDNCSSNESSKESSDTPAKGRGLKKDAKEKKREDSDKTMTREERKIAAYMRAFERMEKAALKRKEVEKRKEEERGRRQSEGQADEVEKFQETPEKKGKRRTQSSPQKSNADTSCDESIPDVTDDTTGSSSESEKPRTDNGISSPVQVGGFRFPKTKKSLMNDWLNENIDPVLFAPNMSPGSESSTPGVPHYFMRTPTIVKKQSPVHASFSSIQETDYVGHSAKKRWLRQAIIDEIEPQNGSKGSFSMSPNSRPGKYPVTM